MSNSSRIFEDPGGSYTGGYVSNELLATSSAHSSNETRGVVQVHILAGTVDFQMRIHFDAPWLTLKTFTADSIEEVVIGSYMRVIVSDSARVWLGQTT
jgi:hypothetical protein